MMREPLEVLRNLAIFKGLPPEHLAVLSGLIRPRRLVAGSVLFEKGKHSLWIYLLLAGTVKVYVERSGGRDIILSICGSGELLGELSLVEGLEYAASVATLEDCEFYRIDREAFWTSLQTMPALSLNLACNTMRRLRIATQVQVLSRGDVVSRVAGQLLAFADQYGVPVLAESLAAHAVEGAASDVEVSHQNTLNCDATLAGMGVSTDMGVTIPLRLTQGDMADLIGASRVRVNQVVNAFKRSGYISIDRHLRVTIHNRSALLKRCGLKI